MIVVPDFIDDSPSTLFRQRIASVVPVGCRVNIFKELRFYFVHVERHGQQYHTYCSYDFWAILTSCYQDGTKIHQEKYHLDTAWQEPFGLFCAQFKNRSNENFMAYRGWQYVSS